MYQSLITNENSEKIQKYNGILLGLFLAGDMVIKLVTYLIPVQNFLVFYYISIIGLGFALNKVKLNLKYLLIYLFISTLFFISIIRVQDNYYTFQYFIYFSTFYFASGILQYETNIPKIFQTINFFNIFYTLFLYFVIFQTFLKGTLILNYTMNLSYTSLIGISSYILSFNLTDLKKSKLFLIVNSFCVLFELYFMFFISNNRGSLIGLAVLFLLFTVIRINNIIFRLSLISIFTALGYLIYSNLYDIILYLYLTASKYNISSNQLYKLLKQIKNQNISSGRSNLYNDAIISFKESPIFGKGIGYFTANHSGQYPHNLFLDVLSSLGIFIAIFTISFTLYSIFKIMKSHKNNYIILVILLFTLTFPELTFSKTLWISPFFWLLFVLIVINPKWKNDILKEQTII